MSKLSNRKCLWVWFFALLSSWGIGITCIIIAFGTVFLWQQAVLPPEDIRLNEYLAGMSIIAWIKHWVLVGIWVLLYCGAFGAGYAGELFYKWVIERYDLLRWRDEIDFE